MIENNTQESLWNFYRRSRWTIKLKLVTIGLLALTICASSSWMIATIIRAQKPAPALRDPAHVAPVDEVASKAEADAFSFSYELRNLSLALESRHSRRSGFAQFSLVLDLPDEKAKRWMELNRAKLLNAVLEVGSRFSLEDLEGNEGKVKFKDLLRETYRKEFGDQAPRDIAIRDWIQH